MHSPVVHVVGARPNFMKAAPVIRALRRARQIDQRLVHTGQHYDALMSDVFFRDLDLPAPDLNLGVGSGSHAGQTAALLVALEEAFARPRAGAGRRLRRRELDARRRARRGEARPIPLAHVEAGLRELRPDDARGGQPGRHRRPVRPAVRDQPGGDRAPRRRGRRRGPDPLRRQPDDRHAARRTSTVSTRRRLARGSASPRAVRRGHAPPPRQRRRPGRRRTHRGRASVRWRRSCRS